MTIDELPTPAVLIERARLEANLRRMQEKADAAGVALRPHAKTHKSVALARKQLAAGAAGLTVAKVGEAEVFVDAGFEDVRIAYPVVGDDKHARIARLLGRARVSFCVDTLEGAQAASDFYAPQGLRPDVLVEVDTGHGRCGIPWSDPGNPAFVEAVAALPGVRFCGFLTHAGQAYHGPRFKNETPTQALQRVALEERSRMLRLAAMLRDEGVSAVQPNAAAGPDGRLEISIGSTPSLKFFEDEMHEGFAVTEIRPGNYVFHDVMQVRLAVAEYAACALTVLATVVSKHRSRAGRERLFLDAGKKVLTSDRAYRSEHYGTLLYNAQTMQPLPHHELTALSEEHAWVHVQGGSTLSVGDRVRLVPNHACVVANTQDRLVVVDGQDVVETLTVDARGRSV